MTCTLTLACVFHSNEAGIMRTQLTAGAAVETVVTLAAAAMMTFAAFAMADDTVSSDGGAVTFAACRAGPAPAG